MTTFKKYLFVCLAALAVSCSPIAKLYVKYGEAKPTLEARHDGVIRLFFDRMGTIYPDAPLTNAEVYSSGSSLKWLYTKTNVAIFERTLKYYGLPGSTTPDELQQYIIDQQVAKINKLSKGKQLVFLIHGYNNHPLKPKDDNSSVSFGILREIITQKYPQRPIQFVDVYWDGCASVNGNPILDIPNSVNIWNNAQAASNNVAIEFRRILSRLDNDNNIVITHSLGASIITCALFNVVKFKDNEFMQHISEKYANAALYSTPTKTFRVGMLAPAIPGANSFDEYHERTPSGNSYNYEFRIGFNARDKVLRKYVGLAQYIGSTTLGCDRTELANVVKSMNVAGHEVVTVSDFSANDLHKQRKHDFPIYLRNEKPMNDMIEFLFR
jgi:hypothetical protein